jgi:hypothetical protein
MCKPATTHPERRVRFSHVTEYAASKQEAEPDLDHTHHLDQVLMPELTKRERKGLLWYSKKELAESRRDVKRTIIAIYEQGGIDLLHYCDKLQEQEHSDENIDQKQQSEHSQLCIRGCERYYSSHGRSQVILHFRKAVLEAQNHTKGQDPNDSNSNSSNSDCLGQISNILSQSNKELAAWYAKLNAADCWGQQLPVPLVAEQPMVPQPPPPPMEQMQAPSTKTAATATMPAAYATTPSTATGTGYRMAATDANKENRLWRLRSR